MPNVSRCLKRSLVVGDKVEGSKLVYRYDTSWHQVWAGTERATQAEITGKTLTLTTAPFKSSLTGLDVVVITTWERVE